MFRKRDKRYVSRRKFRRWSWVRVLGVGKLMRVVVVSEEGGFGG